MSENTQTIRERVLARRDLDSLRAARDLDGLALALNADAPLVRVPHTFVTWRAVVTRCASGVTIKTKMRAAAPSNELIDTACSFLAQETGLDVGDQATWRAIDQMVAGAVLTAAEGQELKDLSIHPQIVDRLEVEADLFNPDGTEK